MRCRQGIPQHHYTDEERQFLKDNSSKFTRRELTDCFNERFRTRQSVQSIISICSALGYKSGNDGKFKKGQSPWCKGMDKKEWLSHLSNESVERIRKGQFGYERKRDSGYPVGYELGRNGYVMVKVTDNANTPCNKRWKCKHVLIWEQYHAKKVPDGCIVIFKDGDNTNFDINNLLMVSRSQSAVLASWNGFNKGELTELYAKSAELLISANKKERED